MILVTNPQQIRVENPDGHSVDSMAMTKEAITANLFDDETPAGSKSAAQRRTETRQDDADTRTEGLDANGTQADGYDEYRLAPEELEQSPIDFEPPAEDWVPPEQPLLPTDNWSSEGTAKTRQYLLVGFLGVSSVVLAVVLFFVFLKWYGSTDRNQQQTNVVMAGGSSPAADPNSGQDGTNQNDANQNDANENGANENGEANSPDIESLDGREPEQGGEVPVGENAGTENSSVKDAGPVDSTLSGVNAGENTPAVNDDSGIGIDQASPSEQTISTLPDALTTGGPLDTGLVGGDASTSTPAQTAKDALPNQLRDFAPVLDWKVQPNLVEPDVIPTSPPLTAEELGMSTGATTDAVPAIDWAVQSQILLPGLIFSDSQPLSQTINLWTHLSGVPTVVDFASLAAADVDRSRSPSLGKIQSASIDSVSRLLADKLGLQRDVRENRFLEYRASAAQLRSKLPPAISLTGLAEDMAATAPWLINVLEEFFPNSIGMWTVSEGQLACDLAQVDLMTWFEAIRLVESWRAAKQLPSGLAGYAPQRAVTHFVAPRDLTFLKHEVLDISVQARPVGQVISRACTEAGIDCWIDWANVGEVGLGPSTSALVITHGRPLERVLADYADMYSLIVAIEDSQTLWLTSNRGYRSQPQTYVVASEGLTAEQWQERLRPLTPAKADGIGKVIAIASPDKEYVMIRCCRPVLATR